MKLLLYVVLFCAMFSCALTGVAPAATPLDDFSGNRPDSSKWYGRFWYEDGLIMVREVTGGKLVSKIGGRTDDNGIASNSTGLIPSEEVTSFSAKVSYIEGAYGPAVDDNDMYGLFAEISGNFYKTAEGAGGDVGSSIGIRYQEDNQGTTLEIFARVYTPSGQIDTPFTTTITSGQEYILKIDYDGDHTLTFSVSDGSQTESHAVTGPTRSGATDGPGLYLGSSIIAAGNIIGGGYVHATFDDVMVNGSLYDDFSSAPLDGNKWIDHEIVREIRDNRLQMNVQNTFGEPSADNQIYLQPQHITNYFQADVIVSGDSVYNGDAHGEALVYGSFYNSMHDGTASSYNDSEGDIYAGTTVSQDANGNLQPQAWVVQCDDSQCDQISLLYGQNFSSCQVQADTPTTFSVENREADATIIFHCDQDELSYQLTGPLYAPRYKLRKLKTSVKSNGNGTGYIKAAFDNVFVKKSRKKSPWNLFLPAILTTGAKK